MKRSWNRYSSFISVLYWLNRKPTRLFINFSNSGKEAIEVPIRHCIRLRGTVTIHRNKSTWKVNNLRTYSPSIFTCTPITLPKNQSLKHYLRRNSTTVLRRDTFFTPLARLLSHSLGMPASFVHSFFAYSIDPRSRPLVCKRTNSWT